MHEHAFHFSVSGRIDAQRAATDGFALAPRDEEADVGRAQRIDVEDVVAFRGIERLEIGVERGEEPHHVILARAFEPDGGHRSASPRYHGRSLPPEAGFFDMRSRKLCFLFCTVVCGIVPLAASAAEPPWIEASDRNSAIVIEMQGAFHPEFASELGVDHFDAAVLDLDPENAKRYDAAAGRAGVPLCIQDARPGGLLLLRLHAAAGAAAQGGARARAALRATQISRLGDRAGPSAAQAARADRHARDRTHAMIFAASSPGPSSASRA